MLRHFTNEFIALNLKLNQTHNELDFVIDAVETENLIMPNIFLRSKRWQMASVVGQWISVLIGSYFRFIMYEYLFEQYKKKELTPVNKLSLVVVLVQHLQQVLAAITVTLMVLNDDSLDHLSGGRWYCCLIINFNLVATSYSCFGSLGVAIYRILLIKHNHWLKYVVGEKFMMSSILFSGIILSVLNMILEKTHDFDTLREDTCMIINKTPIFTLFDEYEQSLGNPSPMSYYLNVGFICIGSLLLATISEIMIYILYFYNVYIHDNNDNLRRLLEPDAVRYRNTRNATSFFAMFCSFAFELTVLLLLLLLRTFGTQHSDTIFVLFWRLRFSAMAMIEVLLSKKLRKRIFNIDF